MAANIKTRAFLVGCPRSGTTLLQSMLFAHPDIYSFPETHFFKHLLGVGEQFTLRRKPQGLLRKLRDAGRDSLLLLGIVDGWSRAKAWKAMRVLPDFDAAASGSSISLRRNAMAFVELADAAALKAGRRMWIEKTPDHLFCAKRIQNYIPDAMFIHIIRNGPDTVASLVDAGRKYPGEWGREQETLVEHTIQRWNIAVKESLCYREDPKHYIVSYEELVSSPVKILSEICGFLGCVFDEKMVADRSEKANNLIRDIEPWKRAAMGPILNTSNTKFKEIFSSVQQDYILHKLEIL